MTTNPFDAFDTGDEPAAPNPGALPWFFGFLTAMSYTLIALGTLIVWGTVLLIAFALSGPAATDEAALFRIRVLTATLMWAVLAQAMVLLLPSLALLLVDIGTSLRASLRRR